MAASIDEANHAAANLSTGEQDYTMLSRRWNSVELVSAETALELARRVHAHAYGAADLAANEPLKITGDGRAWVITGSKPSLIITPDLPLDVSHIADFPFSMKISKFDAQILLYFFLLPTK